MTLMSYTPFDRQVDRLFGEAIRSLSHAESIWTPRSNVYEDADGFYVEAALPGLAHEDVAVMVEDRVVTIRGQRQGTDADKSRNYWVREIGTGVFSRSFVLPDDVDDTKAKASYREGLLRLEFPKREEAKPRQIAIEVK